MSELLDTVKKLQDRFGENNFIPDKRFNVQSVLFRTTPVDEATAILDEIEQTIDHWCLYQHQ